MQTEKQILRYAQDDMLNLMRRMTRMQFWQGLNPQPAVKLLIIILL